MCLIPIIWHKDYELPNLQICLPKISLCDRHSKRRKTEGKTRNVKRDPPASRFPLSLPFKRLPRRRSRIFYFNKRLVTFWGKKTKIQKHKLLEDKFSLFTFRKRNVSEYGPFTSYTFTCSSRCVRENLDLGRDYRPQSRFSHTERLKSVNKSEALFFENFKT